MPGIHRVLRVFVIFKNISKTFPVCYNVMDNCLGKLSKVNSEEKNILATFVRKSLLFRRLDN